MMKYILFWVSDDIAMCAMFYAIISCMAYGLYGWLILVVIISCFIQGCLGIIHNKLYVKKDRY